MCFLSYKYTLFVLLTVTDSYILCIYTNAEINLLIVFLLSHFNVQYVYVCVCVYFPCDCLCVRVCHADW